MQRRINADEVHVHGLESLSADPTLINSCPRLDVELFQVAIKMDAQIKTPRWNQTLIDLEKGLQVGYEIVLGGDQKIDRVIPRKIDRAGDLNSAEKIGRGQLKIVFGKVETELGLLRQWFPVDDRSFRPYFSGQTVTGPLQAKFKAPGHVHDGGNIRARDHKMRDGDLSLKMIIFVGNVDSADFFLVRSENKIELLHPNGQMLRLRHRPLPHTFHPRKTELPQFQLRPPINLGMIGHHVYPRTKRLFGQKIKEPVMKSYLFGAEQQSFPLRQPRRFDRHSLKTDISENIAVDLADLHLIIGAAAQAVF